MNKEQILKEEYLKRFPLTGDQEQADFWLDTRRDDLEGIIELLESKKGPDDEYPQWNDTLEGLITLLKAKL